MTDDAPAARDNSTSGVVAWASPTGRMTEHKAACLAGSGHPAADHLEEINSHGRCSRRLGPEIHVTLRHLEMVLL